MTIARCSQCNVALTAPERALGVCAACDPRPRDADRTDAGTPGTKQAAERVLLGFAVTGWTATALLLGLAGGLGIFVLVYGKLDIQSGLHFLLFAVAPALLAAVLVGWLSYVQGKRHPVVVKIGGWLFRLINFGIIAICLVQAARMLLDR